LTRQFFCSCGCPSPKVSGRGCFGALLMLDPKFVGEAMSVIAANTNAAVTVKCRIGVDDHDSYNELCKFFLPPIFRVISHAQTFLRQVSTFAEFIITYLTDVPYLFHSFFFSGDFIHIVSSLSPTKHFIIHSRKALLSGLSPSDNRRIPPLKCVQKGFHYSYGLLLGRYIALTLLVSIYLSHFHLHFCFSNADTSFSLPFCVISRT